MVVAAEQAGDALGVRVAVRQVGDVERAAGPQDSAGSRRRSPPGPGTCSRTPQERTVSKPASSNGRATGSGLKCASISGNRSSGPTVGAGELLAVVEGDDVDSLLAEERGDLAVAAAPVEHAAGRSARRGRGQAPGTSASAAPSAGWHPTRPTAEGWYETAVIDAIVATRDSRELVLDCVEHLGSPLLERVVVVDNGSVDGTAEALRARVRRRGRAPRRARRPLDRLQPRGRALEAPSSCSSSTMTSSPPTSAIAELRQRAPGPARTPWPPPGASSTPKTVRHWRNTSRARSRGRLRSRGRALRTTAAAPDIRGRARARGNVEQPAGACLLVEAGRCFERVGRLARGLRVLVRGRRLRPQAGSRSATCCSCRPRRCRTRRRRAVRGASAVPRSSRAATAARCCTHSGTWG